MVKFRVFSALSAGCIRVGKPSRPHIAPTEKWNALAGTAAIDLLDILDSVR